jgi:hypothetical protein
MLSSNFETWLVPSTEIPRGLIEDCVPPAYPNNRLYLKVSVSQVLKNSELRERYDDILKNGLPSWMVRRAMKLSNSQMACFMLFIVCLGDYLINVGGYFESKVCLSRLVWNAIFLLAHSCRMICPYLGP